jgi:hypothetical protein
VNKKLRLFIIHLVITTSYAYDGIKGVIHLVIWFFMVLILFILGLALLIDWKSKKTNNNPHMTIHPGAKPGESSNYIMGDSHKDSGGGF